MFEHTLKAKGQRCVMDASMNVNDIFVEVQHNTGIMSTRDYKVYRGLSESLRKLVTPPEIVVYLRCSPETAVKRIHTRGRSSELEVPFQYWCDLNDTYDYWYELYTSSKKMCLEVDNLDFISDTSEEDYALDCIFEYLET
ncbi:Deoxyadenosine/deoxycytidine kinase [compost metagenome]